MRSLIALAAALTAVATPTAAHEFLDYFAYGRAELSPAGYQMVRAAAAYAATGHPVRILVSGHMDSAESAEFSDELSRRRAQAVATELVMSGVDPAVVVIVGQGASSPARITPPGTPEPLNRRVTVGINF